MGSTPLFIIAIIVALVLVFSAGTAKPTQESIVVIVPAATPEPQSSFGCLAVILITIFVLLVLSLISHT